MRIEEIGCGNLELIERIFLVTVMNPQAWFEIIEEVLYFDTIKNSSFFVL